jgi:hypothetical protein
MRTKKTYESVVHLFNKHNCNILDSKEEFDEVYKNGDSEVNYIASCGHNNSIKVRYFNGKCGVICPNCVYKNRSLSLKEKQSGYNKIINNKTETLAINYLTTCIGNAFDIIKTFESCKSDIIIKPKNSNSSLWLGIQIKSTASYINKSYYFNIKKKYTEQLIICISNTDKKMWGFENDDIYNIKSVLQIPISNNSKYNKFEITNNVEDFILNKYNNSNHLLFEKDKLLNQLSKTTLIEYNYRNLRKEKCNFINFIENENQGEVFDFKVGDKKIQEKVGHYLANTEKKIYNYYDFNLSKCNGKNNKKIPYNIGDNNIYWFNCNNSSIFYIIPEYILINYGYIGKKTSIIMSNDNKNKKWLNDFKFDYNNLENDKDKILQILL